MPRQSRAEAVTRRRIDELAASGLGPNDLADRLLTALDAAIPSDGQRLFAVDPATLLLARLLAASDDDAAARLEWLREVYLTTPPMEFGQFPWLMRAGLPAVALQDRPDRSWGYSPAVRELLAPSEWRAVYHQYDSPAGGCLLACFHAEGRWVAALGVHRRAAGDSYRSGEVELLRRLAPSIGRAFAVALRREAAAGDLGAPAPAPDASGVFILDHRSQILFSTRAGEEWAALLAEHERQRGTTLPTAVWSVVRGLEAAEHLVACTVVAPSPAGPVRVEASRGSQPGSVAVVLGSARPAQPPEAPPAWPLTPAEREIVRAVVQGLGNHQLAEQLYVSENTIQTHLHHIYAKLDVHSRSQLVARYFRETYLPGLAGSGE